MLMFKADEVIIEMIDLMLKHGDRTHAAVFSVRIGDEHDRYLSTMNLFAYRPTNYTLIGGMQSDGRVYFMGGEYDWQFLVNHDSCWRDDGVRSYLRNTYFDLVKKHSKGEKGPKQKFMTSFSDSPMLIDVSGVEFSGDKKTFRYIYVDI